MTFSIEQIDFSKGEGLIPVIIQDAVTRQVLMVAFQDLQALKKTIEEGKVTFYSRTKGRLWTKGETSGNFLMVHEIRTDCDKDTLLIRVRPLGPVCHTGTDSCFGEANAPYDHSFLDQLSAVIDGRKDKFDPSSYTASLLNKGVPRIAQKVGEEAVETVIAACTNDNEGLIDESADLLYHLMVLLASKNLRLADVTERLRERHAHE